MARVCQHDAGSDIEKQCEQAAAQQTGKRSVSPPQSGGAAPEELCQAGCRQKEQHGQQITGELGQNETTFIWNTGIYIVWEGGRQWDAPEILFTAYQLFLAVLCPTCEQTLNPAGFFRKIPTI